jgi:hypothetical protein
VDRLPRLDVVGRLAGGEEGQTDDDKDREEWSTRWRMPHSMSDNRYYVKRGTSSTPSPKDAMLSSRVANRPF